MRTKTLLLTAALSAAGVASSMAQVYSVNAVGYYTININNGIELIANQLNTGGNTLDEVVKDAPSASFLYKFDNTHGYVSWENFGSPGSPQWIGGDLPLGGALPSVLAPGEGAFLAVPSPTTLTFVGEVPQGNLATAILAGGQIISSKVPQAGGVTSVLEWGPSGAEGADGSFIYLFDGSVAVPTYDLDDEYFVDSGWINDRTLAVGQAVFLQSTAAKTWSRTFSVNP